MIDEVGAMHHIRLSTRRLALCATHASNDYRQRAKSVADYIGAHAQRSGRGFPNRRATCFSSAPRAV